MSARYLRGSVIYNEHDPLDKGLVGEWRFDRNTGLLLPDYSGRGDHGTLIGPPTWVTTQRGLALDFNGSGDHVLIAASPTLDISGTQPRSIEACFQFDTKANFEVIVDASDIANNNLYRFQFDSSPDQLLQIQIKEAIVSVAAKSATAPVAGVWHHGVGTYDGINLIVFLDGVPGTPVAATGINLTLDNVKIGEYHGGGFNFDGRIALVRVYNRALTPAEARARYELCLRRMQTFGGERRFPVGFVAAEPPVGPFLTTGGGYSLPVG